MILDAIASELQQLYRLDAIPRVGQFLVGACDFRTWCAHHPQVDPQCRETLLIDRQDDAIHVGLYIAPAILETLARHNPARCLRADNLDAACVAIEGVSHLLYVWRRLQEEIPCSLLELELQAEIDKYLLCTHWLRQQGAPRYTLLSRLFHHYAVGGGISETAARRYHTASALAHQFCATLDAGPMRRHQTHRLLTTVRHFYRLTHWQKLRHVHAHCGM